MKSKKKFDPKVIQQYLIDHTEKFVVGLVAALFLYFSYQSFLLPRYDKTTDILKTATSAARERVDKGGSATPERLKKATEFPPYAEIIDAARKPVLSEAYPMPNPYFWKPTALPNLRDVPQVFAVEELRAIPGRGAMIAANAANPGGGAATVGKRWNVVTGLVPYRKQIEEYHAKFVGSALETKNDEPQYMAFFVERAEVVPGEKTPKWEFAAIFSNGTTIFSNATTEANSTMGGQVALEIADSGCVNPNLTSPLPDIVNVTWGEEAVHPPKIPFVPAQRPANPVIEGGAPAPPLVGGRGQNFRPGRGDRGQNFQPGRGGPPVRGGMGGPGTGLAAPGFGLGGPGNGAAGPGIGAGGGILGNNAQNPALANGVAQQTVEAPEYLLLRYFDFNVKPNRKYQYRIFIVLANPNYGLPANVLRDETLARYQYIGPIGDQPIKKPDGTTDWPINEALAKYSLPCTSAPVPTDTRLLAGNVTGPKGPKEVEASVRVLQWLQDDGLIGNYCPKDGLVRGVVPNFKQAPVKIPGVGKVNQSIPLNFILVDIQGGDTVPGKGDKVTTPGIILVMDEAGNLVMHDELTETKEWDDATKEPESAAPPPGQGPPRRTKKPVDAAGAIDSTDLGDTPPKTRGR
jgi:hypothetical protein